MKNIKKLMLSIVSIISLYQGQTHGMFRRGFVGSSVAQQTKTAIPVVNFFTQIMPITSGAYRQHLEKIDLCKNQQKEQLRNKKSWSVMSWTCVSLMAAFFANKYFNTTPELLDVDYVNLHDFGNSLNQLKSSSENKVFIVHGTRNIDSLNSIIKNGLYSLGYMCKYRFEDIACAYETEATSKNQQKYLNSIHSNVKVQNPFQIFFAPQESYMGSCGNIGMWVDPEKTYVFNMCFKLMNRNIDVDELYKQSKVLLSTYLKHINEAKIMQQERPDLTVCLDRFTTKPFYVESISGNDTSCYIAEIPIKTNYIPQDQLVFFNKSFKGITRFTNFMDELDIALENKELIC